MNLPEIVYESTMAEKYSKARALLDDWLSRRGRAWTVKEVTVLDAHVWPDGVCSSIKFVVDYHSPNQKSAEVTHYAAVVDIVTLVTREDTGGRYAVVVEQDRPKIGDAIWSNPSGRLDYAEEDLAEAALREVVEEVGSAIDWRLTNITTPLVGGDASSFQVSPGAISEQVTFFLAEATISKKQYDALSRTVAGREDEDEITKVHLVPLGNGSEQEQKAMQIIAGHSNPDEKTQGGWMRYFFLRDRGLIN